MSSGKTRRSIENDLFLPIFCGVWLVSRCFADMVRREPRRAPKTKRNGPKNFFGVCASFGLASTAELFQLSQYLGRRMLLKTTHALFVCFWFFLSIFFSFQQNTFSFVWVSFRFVLWFGLPLLLRFFITAQRLPLEAVKPPSSFRLLRSTACCQRFRSRLLSYQRELEDHTMDLLPLAPVCQS